MAPVRDTRKPGVRIPTGDHPTRRIFDELMEGSVRGGQEK